MTIKNHQSLGISHSDSRSREISFSRHFWNPNLNDFAAVIRLLNHFKDLDQCDLAITLGTTLKVYPFAGLVDSVPKQCKRCVQFIYKWFRMRSPSSPCPLYYFALLPFCPILLFPFEHSYSCKRKQKNRAQRKWGITKNG